MYQYSVSQWILFFFCYCFLGWIWECCYVSVQNVCVKKKWKWVNRGFLNGPVLPIYGFSAVFILIATIPVQGSLPAIYLFGMLAATTMELLTGSVMERLFRVKYWDYSDMPLNFRGYICLFVSLFWGFFSLLLVKVIHVPIEEIILSIPSLVSEIAAFILVAVFVYDFSVSFREAMDMREMLERLSECKEMIQRLEKRYDAIVAFTDVPDIDELWEKVGSAKERMLSNLERLREERLSKLNAFKEQLRVEQEEQENRVDVDELKKQLEQHIRGVFSRTNKQFLRVTKHLKRNPGAISKKYEAALKELKELFEEKD